MDDNIADDLDSIEEEILDDRIEKIRGSFNTSYLSKQLEDLDTLRDKMLEATKLILKSVFGKS